MAGMSGTSQAAAVGGDVTSAISDAMAGLLSRHTGRGATSSWTTLGRDLIVCVMGDALTKGEKSLVEHGNEEAVLNIRRAFQDTMAADAIALVDRKSTRLNSSHSQISYAVFCLKKK